MPTCFSSLASTMAVEALLLAPQFADLLASTFSAIRNEALTWFC